MACAERNVSSHCLQIAIFWSFHGRGLWQVRLHVRTDGGNRTSMWSKVLGQDYVRKKCEAAGRCLQLPQMDDTLTYPCALRTCLLFKYYVLDCNRRCSYRYMSQPSRSLQLCHTSKVSCCVIPPWLNSASIRHSPNAFCYTQPESPGLYFLQGRFAMHKSPLTTRRM